MELDGDGCVQPSCSVKAACKEYLLFLKEHGVRLGAAAALPKALYELILRNNGVYDLFDAFASTHEVGRGKESPDILSAGSGKAGCPPLRTHRL